MPGPTSNLSPQHQDTPPESESQRSERWVPRAEDYTREDEDFDRRGWRPGSDYYGNRPERYAGPANRRRRRGAIDFR